jgi:pimeloyl-ACP methyl ester carboxylesterase
MVFIPGSGRTTRSDDAAALTIALPQGVAVFRYDKRGLGESTGTFEEVTTENSVRVLGDRASDVAAIVEHLATLPQLQRDRIILWATSQGAWVAPLVARRTNRVSLIIGLVGGGSPVGTVVEYERILRDRSIPVTEGIRRARTYTGPYGYDPLEALRDLRVPVYWIHGGEDRNTPSDLDAERLEVIRASGAVDFTMRRYARMDHNLLDVGTGTFPSTLFTDLFAWAAPRLAR